MFDRLTVATINIHLHSSDKTPSDRSLSDAGERQIESRIRIDSCKRIAKKIDDVLGGCPLRARGARAIETDSLVINEMRRWHVPDILPKDVLAEVVTERVKLRRRVVELRRNVNTLISGTERTGANKPETLCGESTLVISVATRDSARGKGGKRTYFQFANQPKAPRGVQAPSSAGTAMGSVASNLPGRDRST
ncbi:uncharacterized protein BXZ73DRAFT_76255 [Epithele typhae]|uniref:uncharacterized protein n=1 Tax=Epithele typhae TaxID=378194 RepID=UPI00200760AA|nr:uncharacterized protein BXZ73DRAFT_76255 [Epithele typhae]KAH9939127.1 hypothetical protein BXZ73DRAFT_76255 [Epithele typhae]